MAKKNKKIDRRMFKKEGEDLQQYLQFRKRGSVVESKKKYNRQKSKRVSDDEWEDRDSYSTKKVKEYICGCGCKFEAIFELKETKILEIDEPYF